ncbi:TIGR03943 family putative permease subunit [Herbiconiux solani]|uniref:TIGR03943 family putative permease subunit n=1 Tax=Herbiconiux solani TaxID=661329 RepID=UPI000AE33E17|nr:TIGR03943 family protein [Herbiconiux solani]
MRDRLLSRWRGIVLSLIGVVAIVWLAATGQLGLYIHPRYYEFTVVMAVLAGIAVIAAFALVPGAADDDGHDHGDGHGHADGGGHGHADGDRHDHDHVHDDTAVARTGSGWRTTAWVAATALIVAGTVGALLVVPPSTLTSATVDQRDLNASAALTNAAADAAGQSATDLVGSDTTTFTVKDWASLLRQGAGEDYLAGKTADITGFVTPDPADPDNVFYVARFVVTCCAVDAQPVGVPVYLPGWQSDYAVDSWVHATGGFGSNPSTSSTQAIVLEPTALAAVDQPAEPYVY